MKRLLLVFLPIVLISCSFDNKTGIWKDSSDIPVDNQYTKSIRDDETISRYVDIYTKNKTYNEEKKPPNTFRTEIENPVKVENWLEKFGTATNNISNFSYSGNKKLLSKSSRLTKTKSSGYYTNKQIVFYKNNLISHDNKGTIFIYSLTLKKKIFKYNFYKKNFKKVNKKINFIINENILYAADNLGYLYALNLDENSIIWAKNYGIPFRSNLKFINNQIFLSNQDNLIYSINASTGNKNWQFATRPTYLKSDFENNFALDLINNNLFFFNTSGELYSINYTTQKFNWVLNFKNIALSEDTELFISQPIILKKNNLILTTEEALASYDHTTASRNWILSAEPIFKPILTLNYTYAILKNELLICIDNTNGSVIWSKNIFANVKKKKLKNFFKSIIDFKIVNSEVNIYFNNGYLLSFNPANGNLNHSSRISKSGIKSEIVFLNDNMLFIDSKNKLLKFN